MPPAELLKLCASLCINRVKDRDPLATMETRMNALLHCAQNICTEHNPKVSYEYPKQMLVHGIVGHMAKYQDPVVQN